MTETIGYWSMTSSVNFCEPDYIITGYVAEPFNAASSLFISLFGLVGLLYSNPTKEKPFSTLYLLLIAVGLGSVALHATLHWLPQSFDEVPMLWFNMLLLYTLSQLKRSECSLSLNYSSVVYATATFLVTYVYYAMQAWYAAFLFVFIAATIGVSMWTLGLVLEKPYNVLMQKLLTWVFASFCLIGSVCWLIDMNYCSTLLPYYNSAYGCTAHVIWHVAAGYGGYLEVMLLSLSRARFLGIRVHLDWQLWCIPILKRSNFHISSNDMEKYVLQSEQSEESEKKHDHENDSQGVMASVSALEAGLGLELGLYEHLPMEQIPLEESDDC